MLGILAAWGGVSWSDVVAACRRLSPSTFLAAFGVHLAIHAVRAQRFRTLIPSAERPPYVNTFAAASAHNLAAYVLPAKTGEVALVVYLKNRCGVSNRAGLAALLVSRVLDLSTLCLSLALASAYLGLFRPATAPRGVWPGAVLGLGATAALTFLAARGDLLVKLGSGSARLAQLHRTRLGARLLERAHELGRALRESAAGGGLWSAWLQSLVMWLGIFLFYAILARGFGLPDSIGLAEAALGSGFAVLSNLLPINSFAGFGTQEGGWVLGFGLLGVSRELALSTGISVHLVQLLNTVILGVAGHLGMGLLPRTGSGDRRGTGTTG